MIVNLSRGLVNSEKELVPNHPDLSLDKDRLQKVQLFVLSAMLKPKVGLTVSEAVGVAEIQPGA